jgi:hypothetical protein
MAVQLLVLESCSRRGHFLRLMRRHFLNYWRKLGTFQTPRCTGIDSFGPAGVSDAVTARDGGPLKNGRGNGGRQIALNVCGCFLNVGSARDVELLPRRILGRASNCAPTLVFIERTEEPGRSGEVYGLRCNRPREPVCLTLPYRPEIPMGSVLDLKLMHVLAKRERVARIHKPEYR